MRFYYIFVKNQPPISTLSREFTGLDHFARQKKNSRYRSFSSAAESPKMDKANLEIGGILYLKFAPASALATIRLVDSLNCGNV